MKLSKRLMLPMAAIAFLGAATMGANAVSAASDPAGTSLAQKLATTFNLDPAKVQAVLDQDRSEHQAGHAAKYEDRLAQAVADGQLTPAQKQALLAQHKTLQTKLEAAKDKTGPERRATMQAVRQEAADWAKANNINTKWLMPGGHHRHGGSHGAGNGASPDKPASVE